MFLRPTQKPPVQFRGLDQISAGPEIPQKEIATPKHLFWKVRLRIRTTLSVLGFCPPGTAEIESMEPEDASARMEGTENVIFKTRRRRQHEKSECNGNLRSLRGVHLVLKSLLGTKSATSDKQISASFAEVVERYKVWRKRG